MDCFLTACHRWVCVSPHTLRHPVGSLAVLTASTATSLCFPTCRLKPQLWPHEQTHTNIWAASSSLTNQLRFVLLTLLAFLRARFLTHVVRSVSYSVSPHLTCDDLMNFQRDSGRVYGTAESGISSASFKVLHLTIDLSPVLICPPFLLLFSLLQCSSPFISFLFVSVHTFAQMF